VTAPATVYVVGLGPGDRGLLTPQARQAIEAADVVVGYEGYFAYTQGLTDDKHCLALPLTQEERRATLATEHAAAGQTVALICSGDPGIYAMAGLLFNALEQQPAGSRPEAEVVPGISAVNAAAARLGAPIAHDFAVLSLSNLLTPWTTIQRRLEAAAYGDFVTCLYNPRSRRRHWQLSEAKRLLERHRPVDTPVGVVRNAYREDEDITLTTLADFEPELVDMLSIVFIGSSTTRRFGRRLITPRDYPAEHMETASANEAAAPVTDEHA